MIEEKIKPTIDKMVEELVEKHKTLGQKLSDGGMENSEFVKLSKEYSNLNDFIEIGLDFKNTKKDIIDLDLMLKDQNQDPELLDMAKQELELKIKQMESLYEKIIEFLLPVDDADEKNAFLEIRQGTGGDEAGLFAAELLKSYQRYSELQGWKFEMVSISENDSGGIKDAVAQVNGKNVFKKLKFESGVHRVQRIPATESNGRIHTSTITVAVMPQLEDVDIYIDEKDIRIDVYCASGPGGQHVNRTESAVRITHLPTGIAVAMQDERSQIKNKEKAMKILRSRLYEHEREKRDKKFLEQRNNQIGTGSRNEKIRTYNYPQDRCTDHRINKTIYNLSAIMLQGNFDIFITDLQKYESCINLQNIAQDQT
jgi:peptide chain release factor 1